MTRRIERRQMAGALAFLLVLTTAVGAQHLDEASLARLPWRAIGPATMGGRIDDVAVDEKNPSTIYVGAASGGLWKSINAGTTWESLFDRQSTSSIGDVALAPSNADIVWVGTGEPNNRQSSTFGDGVYKSTDAGRTFTNMGLRDSQHIGRVLVDPGNPDIVYVAALGRLWGPNRERGLFKTTDGGRTWTNTLFINEDTGFVDLAMDWQNPQVLYAAAYQRRRAAWGFNGGGPGGGIHKTTDGGKTWTKLAGGLPQGIVGRIGLAVWRKDPRVVYALVEHRDGGTFRSDDAGATWQKVSNTNPRPMYYSKIHIDPQNDQRIYILGSSMFVSDDGGKTFADPGTKRPGANQSMSRTYDVGVHGDHHALWINPANPRHLILGNDGGLYFSHDASITWDKVNNIPLGQYYAVAVDMQKPYNIYGGLQDTHSWAGPSATRHHVGIVNEDWYQINFGDGMYAQPDPEDPDTIYTESQNGNLVRYNRKTGDRRTIKPHPPAGQPAYRFNWTAPIVLSPHDPKTLRLAGNRVFTSMDRGETWTAGEDLTRGEDRDKLPIMGVLPGPDMLSRGDGVAAWGTITTLAESPAQAGVLWAGTDDGQVQVTRDGGKSWQNITERIQGIVRKSRISRVEPSRHDAGTSYISIDRHEADDFAPYLVVTRDGGRTFTNIAAGLPKVGWINVVKEHPANPRVLFVGTENGLFVSINGGQQWTRFTGTFPMVPVDDLVIHPRENNLIVGTHGRSLYVLDDISWLSGATPEALSGDVHLFPPRPATVMQLWKHESYIAQRPFIGPNPPQGAIINLHLKVASPGAKIVVRDPQGNLVRDIDAGGTAGFNRVIWDLRANAPEGVANARGPFVPPGTYRIYLSAAGGAVSTRLQVDWDPLFSATDEQRRSRYTFLLDAGRLQQRIQEASAPLGDVAKQVAAVEKQLKSAGSAAPVLDAASKVAAAITQLQRRVGGGGGGGEEEGGGGGGSLRGQVNGLIGEFEGGVAQQGTLSGPTVVQRARLAAAQAEADKLKVDVDRVLGNDLNRLNEELDRLKIPRIVVPQKRTTSPSS